MAHEKAIREARKALELGYSERDAAKVLKARGLDKDEIKKELPAIKALKEAKDVKKAAQEKATAEAKAVVQPSEQSKSFLWLWILVALVVIFVLFYTGILSAEMLDIKN